MPVCSEYFAHKVFDSEEGYTVQQFCAQNGLNSTAFNIFLTVEHLPERMRDQPARDVILMDRVYCISIAILHLIISSCVYYIIGRHCLGGFYVI